MDSSSHIPPGMLLRVMREKQGIIVYYEQLRTMTVDSHIRGIIDEILFSEAKQLDLFKNLYLQLFAEWPELEAHPLPQIDTFMSGIQHSVINESSMYSFYGNIYFTDPNLKVRETFLRALFDENIHATMFTYIYSTL